MSEKTILETLTEAVENLSEESIESFTTSDYILDIKFIVKSDLSFFDVIVVVTTGGPHIEFCSENKSICGYWSNEKVERYYNNWREVFDYWEDYYNSILGK